MKRVDAGVRGGQGRSPQSVADDSAVLAFIFFLAAVTFAVLAVC